MARWTYIIPRLIILGLIGLALWIGADPLTRTLIVNAIEDTTGAKVEIGQLRCSIQNEKLFIKDIAFADPSDPTRNLAQADMVYVEIDSSSLLNQSVVITGGQTSRLMFHTPRTTDGKLPHRPITPQAPFEPSPPRIASTGQIGQRWLDQLEPVTKSVAAVDNEHLYKSSEQLIQSWTSRLDAVQRKIDTIADETHEFENLVKSFEGNFVRWNRWQTNNHVQLESIETHSASLLETLKKYEEDLASDLTKLNKALQIDSSTIENSIQTTSFDSDDMTNLLLDKMHAEYVDQVMNTFRWFRHVTPEPQIAFASKSTRGADIRFPGTQRRPRFVVQQIELNGENRLFDQDYNFSGYAYNLSAEPELLDQPARFELRAQGNKHLILNCVIDRRFETPVDSLKLICPELDIEGRSLGDESSLQVTLGQAGKLQAEIDLTASGDEIIGTIKLRHTNVSLHVDHLNDLAGGEETALLMNQGGLGLIKEFESTIEISGKINNYQHAATSNLGHKFSVAVNSILQEKKAHSIAQRKQMLEKTKQMQIQVINESIVKRIRTMSESLKNHSARFAELNLEKPRDSRIENRFR